MDQARQQSRFEQLASLLLANGIQPGRNETTYEFIIRIEAWNRVKKHFNGDQINEIRDNAEMIRTELEKMMTIRTTMMATGQGAKWIVLLQASISKAGSWAQLIKATSALSTKELISFSFGKTIANRSLWIITAGITAIQIGIQFKYWHSGQITGKQFWGNVGKKIIVNGVSVAGGLGGSAALGATIGMCFGPVGAVVGIILGGIVGSVSAAYATEKIFQACENKYIQYTSAKLLGEALEFYDLQNKYSQQELQSTRKYKIAQYHPDKWLSESEERQRAIAQKYAKTETYYEILKSAIDVRNNPNVEPRQLQ